ncbi:hypothetical protein GGR57DRAFT_77311 [Xylariaceae sp. FL1272]|nr:hypothetical protein GGR57DRAFT_77311 [Xylariaceae sp. FL1272]
MSTDTETPIDYTNDGPRLIAGFTALAFVGTVVVGLRLWSRRLIKTELALDDYLAVTALAAAHLFYASAVAMVTIGGLGRDIRLLEAEGPGAIEALFKTLLAAEVLYGLSSPLIKLAVLTFLWRIFPTPTMRIGCIVLSTLSIIWFVAIEIVNFLQCIPLKAFWQVELQALPTTKCFNFLDYFLGNSIANAIIDFATLVLPVTEILKLQLTRSKKLALCGVFLFGGITLGSSLARTIGLGMIIQEGATNFTKQFETAGTASVVEIYAGVIASCLPLMMPVYHKLRHGVVTNTQTVTPTPIGGQKSNTGVLYKDASLRFERIRDSHELASYDRNRNTSDKSLVE